MSSEDIFTANASFQYFPKLPEELRRRIWAFAASQPRVIEVRQLIRGPPTEFHSPTLPPAVLAVSSESRHEALCYYEKVEVLNEYMGENIESFYYAVSFRDQAFDRFYEKIRRQYSEIYGGPPRSAHSFEMAWFQKQTQSIWEKYYSSLTPFRAYINWGCDTLYVKSIVPGYFQEKPSICQFLSMIQSFQGPIAKFCTFAFNIGF